MVPYMCRLFLVIFVLNKVSFASGRIIKSGTFKYLHRHPKLKSCAMEVLKENVYVGCRVHVQKGGCEGLNHSWAINQTTESGYAYAKKQLVEMNEGIAWNLPGVLSAGSKVETTIASPSSHSTFFVLTARDMESRYLGSFRANYNKFENGINSFVLSEEIPNENGDGNEEVQRERKNFQSTKKTSKITFLSLRKSLMVLVDDQTIWLLKNLTVELTAVKEIEAFTHVLEAKLHGFKFSGV